MDILEKAKELSMAISQDERCKKLQLARAANEEDLELQKLIGAFNLKKIMLNAEYKKDSPQDEKVKALESDMRDLYGKIMKNGHMAAFSEAQKEMNELLSHINSIIQLAVTGEVDTPDGGCSGSCEGCSGCH